MHPNDCWNRLIPELGHKWVVRYWDKFGTGKKVPDGKVCKRCGAIRR